MPPVTPTASPRASVVEVARHAGVSVGTVSNYLNRPDKVAAATSARVRAAIDDLGFTPSIPARQLRLGTMAVAGAIVLDLGNPFFTDLALGMQNRLARDEWTVMLAGSQQSATDERRFLTLFEQHGLQAVAVVPATDDVSHLTALAERGLQVVLLDRASPDPRVSSVAVDDVFGGRLAAEHLLGLGHTRLAMLNGPQSVRQCADRFAGAVAAAGQAGLGPEAIEEVTVTLDPAGGQAGVERLLASDRPPTALFCVNDLVALGALRTLRNAGLGVPDDMAVIGYDDVSYASELLVPLSSIRQPAQQIGVAAAELLLRPPGDQPGAQVWFQPELMARASTTAAAA
ncbi:MAG: substrate-binding domain-containing protein [Promicromonosporaceae bacterium]|nr:substrate-binding domain-containing protein [Promicromonosporaceae bacterium]